MTGRCEIDRRHLAEVLAGDDRSPAERETMIRLMEILAELGDPPGSADRFPRYGELKRRWLSACTRDDPDELEERFLELYAHLHMHEAPYTEAERRRMDRSGGYWSHAGGLSPVLRAGQWIRPDTTSVDLGAGNGLQALLIQRLFPHRRADQIEISSAMVEIGRDLQRWLGVPRDRVRWRVDDVLTTPLGGWSFVYLYRPVRPTGPGREFYSRLAATLADAPHEVVVFSIADPLGEFLPPVFKRFYGDGHLTCYRKP